MKVKLDLQNMSVDEKGFVLNRLMKLLYSGTQCDGGVPICKIFDEYDKTTNMLLDSYMWQIYGLHYKDYIETGALSFLCTWDVRKLETSIDRRIRYLEHKLFCKSKG